MLLCLTLYPYPKRSIVSVVNFNKSRNALTPTLKDLGSGDVNCLQDNNKNEILKI